MSNRTYTIVYKMTKLSPLRSIDVLEPNKQEARHYAFENSIFYKEEGYPYKMGVKGVTYSNGNYHPFPIDRELIK